MYIIIKEDAKLHSVYAYLGNLCIEKSKREYKMLIIITTVR